MSLRASAPRRSPRVNTLLVALLLVEGATSAQVFAAGSPPIRGRVREPAEAGSFYPADARVLSALVRERLAAARRVAQAPVRSVLVPHAGVQFSAAVAAAGFKQLDADFDRVVILAGNHNGEAPFTGVSVDDAAAYRVPGLEVKVARAAASLRKRAGYVDAPAAHTMHMVEIELPFLAALHPAPFEIVPVIVGDLDEAAARSLARDLHELDDGRTRFVFSVDLSHYRPYATAVLLDRACLEAIAQADATGVAECTTDATQLLGVMIELSALSGTTPRLVQYANSGDVMPSTRDRVVGYGAVAFEEGLRVLPREGEALLALARREIEERVRTGHDLVLPQELLARHLRLRTPRAAFVTLEEDGALRGCIGTLSAGESLALAVLRNAGRAATSDPRFPPVTVEELPRLAIHFSVLEPPRPLPLAGDKLLERLRADHPGLVILFGGDRSVFLPEVWEELPDAVTFVEHLCRKQGAPASCWRSPQARFEIFGAQVIRPREAATAK